MDWLNLYAVQELQLLKTDIKQILPKDVPETEVLEIKVPEIKVLEIKVPEITIEEI